MQMQPKNPFYISPQGGSITCFIGDNGRLFKSCSHTKCIYTGDLHSAKAHLDSLESINRLQPSTAIEPPIQRKTTLKWKPNGELSAIDMARIVARLENRGLTDCELSCEYDEINSKET